MQLFCPNEAHVRLVDINLASLWDKGIHALILDLDNTLVAWDKTHISPETHQWIIQAKEMGFSLCIASNSLARRVVVLAQDLDIPFVAPAIKPRRTPFRKAIEIMGKGAHETAVVGDQIFTDILGGNRLGLYTILTRPLSQKELPNTRLIRWVEKYILRWLINKGHLAKW